MIKRLDLSSFWALFFILVTALGATVSCSWRGAVQPSILVIAVENLGFGAFSCNEGPGADESSGFRTFCEEAVRFTHAYTPSTMSQASIASLLTGRQPYEHGVRNNGSQFLSAHVNTAGEAAVSQGYRTYFVTGGPPIFRKSGFAQGFETFDDSVPLSLSRIYRQAHEVVNLFLNWQESEAPRGRFLGFLFLSDLQFIDSPTTNAIGELRESSYESQVDEIGESLAQLVHEMKRRKIWDSTYVVLVGLNGFSTEPRLAEARSINLFSESTRVSLMIKPARKMRDGPFNWKVDSNVSLTDVGATLFELLGRPLRVFHSLAPARSLMSVLRGPEPDWPEDRKILSETAWARWHGWGNIRYAVRTGPYLYIQDQPDMLFNTLTDSMETLPLPESDERYLSLRSDMLHFLRSIRPTPWEGPNRLVTEKQELARELWRNRVPSAETLERLKALSRRYPRDEQLNGWRAIWALRVGDWKELKAVSSKPETRPTWAYVAARNLGEKATLPEDPCFAFLKKDRASDWHLAKECEATGLSDLVLWGNEREEMAIRNQAMESFLRSYASRALATRVAEHNYVSGLMWDTNLDMLHAPDTIDLILALPEMKKFRTAVVRRLASGS